VKVSADYRIDPENPLALDGWTVPSVARRQHAAMAPLIAEAKNGNPRVDFRVAADVIAATGESNPLIVEVGCGSGYYGDILSALVLNPVRYIGLDYSTEMTGLARASYPDQLFVAGDALALPFATESCDISLSGTSLMHIPDYRIAIQEMVRVSRRWCVFHTVPVLARRPTTVMSKLAYGAPVAEIIFNRGELEGLFAECGLRIRRTTPSLPYDVGSIVGERTFTLTYLCERAN
jgi:SAM-dependent methyltransferase